MSDTPSRAGPIFTTTAVLALAAAAVWSGSALSDAKQAAADAAGDTAACRRYAEQISACRRSPTTGPATDDLGPRLERALAAADVDPSALTRVAPQPPRPIGQTGLARRSTQVGLQLVTVRQALSFVSNLSATGPRPLTLESFRLSVPAASSGDPGDEWDVELSVSQVVPRGNRP